MSPSDGSGGVYEDLKWTARLCCQLPSDQKVGSQLAVTGGLSGQCQLLNATKPESPSKSHALSGELILLILYQELDTIAFCLIFMNYFVSIRVM